MAIRLSDHFTYKKLCKKQLTYTLFYIKLFKIICIKALLTIVFTDIFKIYSTIDLHKTFSWKLLIHIYS